MYRCIKYNSLVRELAPDTLMCRYCKSRLDYNPKKYRDIKSFIPGNK